MDWDTYFSRFWDWSDSTRTARISALTDIGPGDEVTQAVLELETESARARLVRKALQLGGSFSEEDLGLLDEMLPEELYEELLTRAGCSYEELTDDGLTDGEPPSPAPSATGEESLGCGCLLGFLSLFGGARRHDSRCNGDCAHCPPHYGYRHGRWYYGHGHQYGCERGGNGGASGKTYQD